MEQEKLVIKSVDAAHKMYKKHKKEFNVWIYKNPFEIYTGSNPRNQSEIYAGPDHGIAERKITNGDNRFIKLFLTVAVQTVLEMSRKATELVIGWIDGNIPQDRWQYNVLPVALIVRLSLVRVL